MSFGSYFKASSTTCSGLIMPASHQYFIVSTSPSVIFILRRRFDGLLSVGSMTSRGRTRDADEVGCSSTAPKFCVSAVNLRMDSWGILRIEMGQVGVDGCL